MSARRWLLVAILAGLTAVALWLAHSSSPRARIRPHLGRTGRVQLLGGSDGEHSSRQWLEEVELLRFESRGGTELLIVRFSGMHLASGDAGGAAGPPEVPLPLDRILEIDIDDHPVYRARPE